MEIPVATHIGSYYESQGVSQDLRESNRILTESLKITEATGPPVSVGSLGPLEDQL